MSGNKRYYWFKMSEDFFKDRKIKQLRKLAGGDTYTLIYMKMLILVLPTQGVYEIDEYETLADALSLDIDEELENVQVTIEFLKRTGLINEISETSFKFNGIEKLIGSETASTIRSRKSRENKKVLQCNTNATQCNKNSTQSKSKSIEYRDQSIEYRESIEDNNSLSQEQYDSLIKEYGKTLVDEKIANASNYKNCMKYEKIREWCEVDKNKTPKKSTNKFNNFKQREYSKEEMEEVEKAFFN